MIARAYRRLTAWPAPLRLAFGLAAGGLVAAASSAGGPGGAASFSRAYALNLAHVPLYALFALGVLLQFPRLAPRQPLLWALVLGATLGAGFLDEWHQQRNPQRSASCVDLGSDLLGGVVALAAARWASDHPTDRAAGRQLAACLGALVALWGFVPAIAGDLPLPFARS